VRDDRLQKVYFRRPELTISQSARDEILMKVDRTSPEEKARDYLLRFGKTLSNLKFQVRQSIKK
jgi:hypothetical protein